MSRELKYTVNGEMSWRKDDDVTRLSSGFFSTSVSVMVRARTSSAHAAVMRNASVRYVRVTTGVLRYHSSRDCGMVGARLVGSACGTTRRTRSWLRRLSPADDPHAVQQKRFAKRRGPISALLVKSMSNRARGAVAPLALPAAAPSSVLGPWLENDAVDALPYADTLPAGWRESADALVRDELRRSEAIVEDYVAKLPQVPALSFKARRGRHSFCQTLPPFLTLVSALRVTRNLPRGVQ